MHDHQGHVDLRRANRRRLSIALAISLTYMVAEGIGGLLTGSLALLADAGHLMSDSGALSLSLFAIWVAGRPPTPSRTYGHARAEILAALAHGVVLSAVALVIALEAVERLGTDHPVQGLGMVAVASGALVVNLCAAWILNEGRRESLNVQGAWLHVLTDALGSAGVIVAGLAIWAFGWLWADPVASLVISSLVLFSAWQLLREAVSILMETAPGHLDVHAIRTALGGLRSVHSIHDLHVWTIGSGEVSLSAHLVARHGSAHGELLSESRALLSRDFAIDHTTIQIEGETAESEAPSPAVENDCGGSCGTVATADGSPAS